MSNSSLTGLIFRFTRIAARYWHHAQLESIDLDLVARGEVDLASDALKHMRNGNSAGKALRKIGRVLATRMETEGIDSSALLALLHRTDGGGGPREAIKLWEGVKVQLQRAEIQLQTARSLVAPKAVGTFSPYAAAAIGQCQAGQPVSHMKVSVVQRRGKVSVSSPGMLVAERLASGRDIHRKQLSTELESIFLGNRADVQAVLGQLGHTPHAAAVALHDADGVAPFIRRIRVFFDDGKFGFVFGTEGHYGVYGDKECIPEFAFPIPEASYDPPAALDAEVSEIVDVARTTELCRELRETSAGARGSTEPQGEPPICYVTLLQAAAIVNRSKPTLERYLAKGKLPPADVQGVGGKPSEWVWATFRPHLEREFEKSLPEVFPANRFVRQ